jgi:hypothetical protein
MRLDYPKPVILRKKIGDHLSVKQMLKARNYDRKKKL